ncbi:hypothetical protein F66182_9314 [Fusarium sp. NRRL 66182]|nr:hypothetical protein F66182_9314 [Fusarium sp. NRRL 66182]
MSILSLIKKAVIISGQKPYYGPAHPNSYPVHITEDLIQAALPSLLRKGKPWSQDPEYRIIEVMVRVPRKFCTPGMVNAMDPDLPGKHPSLVAIALGRFRRTPEHPGGELVGLARSDWGEMSVVFDLKPRETVSVAPVGWGVSVC